MNNRNMIIKPPRLRQEVDKAFRDSFSLAVIDRNPRKVMWNEHDRTMEIISFVKDTESFMGSVHFEIMYRSEKGYTPYKCLSVDIRSYGREYKYYDKSQMCRIDMTMKCKNGYVNSNVVSNIVCVKLEDMVYEKLMNLLTPILMGWVEEFNIQ